MKRFARVRFSSAAIAAVPFIACAGDSADRPIADDAIGLEQPASEIADSASVKVVSFSKLPPVDAADWQWGVNVRWSIPTELPGVDPIVFNPRRLAPLGDSLVAVLDAADYRIVILETPSGRVRSRFGRAGAGPGEIMDPVGLLWGDSVGSLWVADRANRRVSRFEQSGALVAEAPLPATGGASGVGTWEAVPASNSIAIQYWSVADPQNNALVDSLKVLNLPAAKLEDAISLPPRPSRADPGQLFAPAVRWVALPAGGFVIGNTHSATYRHFNAARKLQTEIRLPLEPRAISPDERLEIVREFQGLSGSTAARRQLQVGDVYPIANVLVALDDSVFAIQHSRRGLPAGDPDMQHGEVVWRVLSTGGRYLGVVRFEAHFVPMWVDHGRVLGLRRDSLGVPEIEEVRILKPDGLG